jgi:hypothetical protein
VTPTTTLLNKQSYQHQQQNILQTVDRHIQKIQTSTDTLIRSTNTLLVDTRKHHYCKYLSTSDNTNQSRNQILRVCYKFKEQILSESKPFWLQFLVIYRIDGSRSKSKQYKPAITNRYNSFRTKSVYCYKPSQTTTTQNTLSKKNLLISPFEYDNCSPNNHHNILDLSTPLLIPTYRQQTNITQASSLSSEHYIGYQPKLNNHNSPFLAINQGIGTINHLCARSRLLLTPTLVSNRIGLYIDQTSKHTSTKQHQHIREFVSEQIKDRSNFTHNKSNFLLIHHQLHRIQYNTVHGNSSIVPITESNPHLTTILPLQVLTNNYRGLHTSPIEIYKSTPTQALQNLFPLVLTNPTNFIINWNPTTQTTKRRIPQTQANTSYKLRHSCITMDNNKSHLSASINDKELSCLTILHSPTKTKTTQRSLLNDTSPSF